MAQRNTDLNINISATDKASPTIERLEKKIDGLESDEARIVVSAQTDKLESQLKLAKAKLDGLDGDEATVQARLIGNLETQLEDAQTLFRELDGKTGTVHINAVNKASSDIDKVGDELRRLDGDTAKVKVDVDDGGGGLGAGLAGRAGLAAIPALLAAGALEGANLHREVGQVAQLTGASLEDASRLIAVWQDNGQEVSDLQDILLNVNQVLRDNPELAEQLGVKIDKNTSLVDLFVQAVDGVSTSFDNAGDRAVAASQLFGEEGVRQVNTVTSSVGLLGDAVDDVPEARITSPEDLERAKQINTEMTKMKGHLTELKLALAEGLIPWVNQSIEKPFSWGSFFNTALMANPITAPAGALLAAGSRNVLDAVLPGDTREGTRTPAPLRVNPSTGAVIGGAVTVINSYGTAANTVDAGRIYQRRNGPQ